MNKANFTALILLRAPNKTLVLWTVLLGALNLWLIGRAAFAEDYSHSVYVGTGKVEITPEVGTPLAGFGKRKGKPSTGVHDPIFARAIALDQGENTFVFVSADLVLIDEDLRKNSLKKIQKTHPLPPENFILMATHTHSAPGAIGGRFWERFIMGKFRKPVFDRVTNGIAEAAAQAMDQKIPVEAEYGEADISELVENRMDERLNIPDKLRLLRFREPSGKSIAAFLFMAAHPTILPASNRKLSADFPGAAAKNMETKEPGSVALFVNGAAGDLRPHAPDFEDRFHKMEAYGFQIAGEAQKIRTEKINLNGPWRASLKRTRLPWTKIRLGFFRVPSILGNRFFPRKSYFQAVRAGPLLFMTFPGELGSEIGRDMERRAEAKGFQPFLIGFANDYVAYAVPRRTWKDRSQYESQASFYGPKFDWFIQKTMDGLVDGLRDDTNNRDQTPMDGALTFHHNLPILKLKGDPYHVGYEEGRLLSHQIKRGTDQIFRYFRHELRALPLINRLIIHRIASRAWKKMEPYVSYDEYLQMKGIADGSGVSFRTLKKIHALPEIYPTFCTNGAYWGSATKDGRLIAIRNLDWNRKMGIHEHAAVKFIDIPGRKKYVNIGYYGFTGVLSGLNEYGISVGQIGAASKDETMEGAPMPFLLKRVLEESGSIDNAVKIFKRTDRTRGYNYVIADAINKKAVVIETTRSHLAVFSDNDPNEKDIPYSLSLDDAVFRGDPALNPTIRDLQWASKGNPKKEGLEMPAGSAYEIRYLKHGNLVKDNFGKMDPEIAKDIARQVAPGSNIQSVVYAFPEFFVANAQNDKKAAESEYIKFNWDELAG